MLPSTQSFCHRLQQLRHSNTNAENIADFVDEISNIDVSLNDISASLSETATEDNRVFTTWASQEVEIRDFQSSNYEPINDFGSSVDEVRIATTIPKTAQREMATESGVTSSAALTTNFIW